MSDLYAWERPRDMPTEWKQRAACAGMVRNAEDALIFHPEPGGDESVWGARGLAICAVCTVRTPCLEEALSMPRDQDQGIRGGTTRRERLAMRKRRERTRR